MSPLTGRRNLSPLSCRKTNTGLPTPRRMCQAPPAKRRNHTRPTTGTQGFHPSGPLTPQAARSHPLGKTLSSSQGTDSCDMEDHLASSSRHKDRSCSDKSSRCGSDKESSSTPRKHALLSPPCAGSVECPWKEPHVDEPSHIPHESSCANYRSPSRSMSELKDHGSFTAPTSSSTPNKLGTQLPYRSSSNDSRLSMMPLDMGLYNSFSYYGPTGFSRGGATPMASVAGSQCVSSSMWKPPRLTSPPVMGALNAEQSRDLQPSSRMPSIEH